MRDEGYQFPQRIARKPIRALTMEDLEVIQRAADRIGSRKGRAEGMEGCEGQAARIAYVATRAQTIRAALCPPS